LNCTAQDVHFSQYFFSPLTLNPAHTGNFKADYRGFLNFRSQWKELGEPYETYSAGGDINFYPKGQNYSGGFLFLNDRSGGDLLVNKVMASGAKHLRVAGFKLHAGLQTAFIMKRIDPLRNSYPNQLNWNIGRFDPTLPNYEPGLIQKDNFLDINVGVAAEKKIGKFIGEFGLAFFHLNRPKESLNGQSVRIPVRKAITLGAGWQLNEKLTFKLHSLYGFTTKTSDWVSGFTFDYIFSSGPFFNNSFFTGMMWRSGINRNADAGIVTAGFNINNYTIGFSYDLTFSKLKTSVDMRGAYEIALIFRGRHTRITKKEVPCERY